MATLLTDNLYYEGKQVLMLIRNDEVIFHNVHKESEQPIPYDEQYLTFDIVSGGTILWKSSSLSRTIQYCKNGGNWTTITSSSAGEVINVNAGDKLKFRGDNAQYGTDSSNYNSFSGSTALFNTYGNIMSLIESEDFKDRDYLTGAYNFKGLFENSGVVDANNLILPTTALTNYCYYQMFLNCTRLVNAPELPATTLADGCYQYMFYGCTSLTSAPELSATTLANSCYRGMLRDCTSLTSAPELPATTLKPYCYYYMFYGCTGLTSAPVLPATTLANYCYQQMFYNCTSLNYIKCLATNKSAFNCTQNWVQGVASSGTFVKNSSMSSWGTGVSGIPSGWTVQDA